MNPWEYTAPPLLYKYLSPDRIDVLIRCRLRFSQRTVFQDDHELQPEYAAFGTLQEIQRQINRTGLRLPDISDDELALLIAQDPVHQARAVQIAIKNIKSIDAMGILCLTETANSEQMWREYAADGCGFVIAFDTAHVGFRKLTGQRGVGKVSYSDRAFETLLGMMEKDVQEPLYRKRMKYAFEQEWRSIRLLKDLVRFNDNIYVSPFDPASVHEIILGSYCEVETSLQELGAGDSRYQHVQIVRAT